MPETRRCYSYDLKGRMVFFDGTMHKDGFFEISDCRDCEGNRILLTDAEEQEVIEYALQHWRN